MTVVEQGGLLTAQGEEEEGGEFNDERRMNVGW